MSVEVLSYLFDMIKHGPSCSFVATHLSSSNQVAMADDELQVHGSPGSSSVVATHLSSSKQVAMADDELQVHGSPGSSGSTNSCLRTLAQVILSYQSSLLSYSCYDSRILDGNPASVQDPTQNSS